MKKADSLFLATIAVLAIAAIWMLAGALAQELSK